MISTDRSCSIRRAATGLLVVSTAAVLLTACSSSSKSGASTGAGSGGSTATSAPTTGGTSAAAPTTGGSTTSSKDVTVVVKNFEFTPKSITVNVGTKVTWKFEDSTDHTVQADDKKFMSTDLKNGGTYSFTFNSPGTYPYICSIHQYMTGTVTVK